MNQRETNPLRPLTPKEKTVLEFIESFMLSEGYAPSYLEIKEHFGFASFNSVQRYLKQLQSKEYIHIPGGNQKRAITLLQSSQSTTHNLQGLTQTAKSETTVETTESFSLPLLGRVAAGRPIEALEHNEFFDTPPSLVSQPGASFCLIVEGQSMIEDGIFDGDVIVVQKQPHAKNGDIIVANVDNEATVKRFYLKDNKIELRPSNSEMQSMWFSPDEVEIEGVVTSLMRKL